MSPYAFDLDGEPDEVGNDERQPRAFRWLGVVAALLVVGIAAGVSLYDSAQREHRRAAYDRVVALSAAGEQAVASAVSQTRDVVQYAEPLLNSAQTTPTTRTTLLQQISDAAQRGRVGIEAQRALLAAAPAPGKLQVARDAAEKYLADWAAVFGTASGEGAPLGSAQADFLQEQTAARDALRAAAPDKHRAAEADTVLGSLGW
jgi:hypothetical protein